MTTHIEHLTLDGRGVRLHVAAAGPHDGGLVVLLHGFPEGWFAWEAHMAVLADAGYRVLAPDQRGYNTSDKPPKVDDYRIDLLVEDVASLIEGAGREKASIVGHDWGGAVVWRMAQTRPDRLHRVSVINCVPPEILQRTVLTSPRQALRSWYVVAMQVPRVPEAILSANDFARLVSTMKTSSAPGTFSDEALHRYRQAWGQPGALRAMINWYRAAGMHPGAPESGGKVDVPMLLLWGDQDRFLGYEMVEPCLALCSQGRLVRFEGSTHWVNHEQTHRVCDELIAFFGETPAATARPIRV